MAKSRFQRQRSRKSAGSGCGSGSGAWASARARARLGVSVPMVIGALVAGWATTFPAPAGATGVAITMKANQHYATAQLVKLSDLPAGWSKAGPPWVGTTESDGAGSMLTMTQLPDLSSCMGISAPLSVTAAEADSPNFFSQDQSTNVFDVADVYASTGDAKSDFPPANNPKFASCFAKVLGPAIISIEQSEWDTGTTFGTPTASVVRSLKYGDQSVMLEAEVPVNIPDQGSTNDFFTVLALRQGRSTAEVFIDQADVPPSASLTAHLAKVVAARMKAPPPSSSSIVAA
jgi:hypothetical protein